MNNLEKILEEFDEYGAIHEEDCCVNFEGSRACDVGTELLECCERMQIIKAFLTKVYNQAHEAGRQEAIEEVRGNVNSMLIYDSDDTSRSVINKNGYNDGLEDVLSSLKDKI